VRVWVNGDVVEVAPGATVTDLLGQLGLDGRWVVAERNREPVERRTMSSTVLAEDDRIELVRAVAGG
jgi:thiamine biosynthesis protein ThiS